MAAPVSALIETIELTRRFGAVTAVAGITFSVGRGEVVAFLGPNGAGKTTTMRMIAGFLPPSSGTARVAGHDVRTRSVAARRCLGVLPEGSPLYPEMSPEALLRFAGRVHGLTGAALSEAVTRVLGLAQLQDVRSQPIETLSKGFRRRVGLAFALLHDPPALLLDEPTDGLDPNQKRGVRRLIASMAPAKAILVSTHTLEEVTAVCTRAVVIARGRIVADETPAELAARSQTGNLDDVFRTLTEPAATEPAATEPAATEPAAQ